MQTKYTVKVYLARKEVVLMDMLDTNSWSEVEEFVWQKCQEGMNCTIIYNEFGTKLYAYAEDFNEDTIEAAELIKGGF